MRRDETEPSRDDRFGPALACRTERGISFTVSYVVTLAITTVLIAGVLIAAGGIVQDQRENAIQGEATVVADKTAAGVMAADRLVRQAGRANVTINLQLPQVLANKPYTVGLRTGDDGTATAVVIRTQSPSVRVSVPLTTRTTAAATTVTGGEVRVVYRADTGELTLKEGAP